MDMSNWAESFQYRATAVHFPESVGVIPELVASSPSVRALGTRHSFSDVADAPGGALITLERVPPGIVLNEAANTVSVTAGTSYGVLAAELERRGLALENLGSLPHISIGGAVSTATHGSGDANRVLSASVAAVELVRADGTLSRVDRSSPDLAAVAVGLGAFGIMTRVELDVQPTYLVRQDVYRDASWKLVLDHLDEVMALAYSVCLIGDISGPVIRSLWLKQRLDSGGVVAPPSLYGGTWWDDADLPTDHALTVRAGIPGPWSERMAHFRLDGAPSVGGDELQSEYFVDRSHGPAALQELRSMALRISPHLHGMEIRTVAADDLWLSPAYERPTLSLGFTWRKHPSEVKALLPDIEAALEPFQPRPHWGKLFHMSDLHNRFPRLGDFLDLAHAYDPGRKFWNPFLERLATGSGP